MTTTCPQPAAIAMPAGDPLLDAELAEAGRCAAVLEEAGLRVAFEDGAGGPLEIVLEGSASEPLRRLGARELLDLLTLAPAQLRRWAARPELPIPGRPA